MKAMLYFSISILLALFSCSENNPDTVQADTEEEFTGEIIESENQKFGVEKITTDLRNPWGLAFLPDGRILVTERAGSIRIVKDGKLLEERISGVPKVYAQGQGGLLDIQLHPVYATNGWIYLSYSKPGPGGAGTTIARTKLNGNAFTEFQELFSAQPFTNSGAHFGSRIAFDGNGYMFFSSGERGEMQNAQNLQPSWQNSSPS